MGLRQRGALFLLSGPQRTKLLCWLRVEQRCKLRLGLIQRLLRVLQPDLSLRGFRAELLLAQQPLLRRLQAGLLRKL